MGKASSPAAPNYAEAAKQTAAGNLQNAQYATAANRPNMSTPWGTSTWTETPQYDMNAYNAALDAYKANSEFSPIQLTSDGVPMANSGGSRGNGIAPQLSDYSKGSTWSNSVSLSPSQQAIFDQQNNLQQGLFGAQNNALGYVNDMMSKPFSGQPIDPNSFTYGSVLDPNSIKLGTVLADSQMYDPTRNTNNATQLIMDRLNPQLDRQEGSLRARLANSGVTMGSDAYNNANESFGRTRNDAMNQAALAGINLGMAQSQLGTQQQAQQFGQTNQNAGLFANFQNQAFNQQNANNQLYAAIQNQGFNQAGYAYNLPMNTLNALRAGNQVSAPQFQSFANQQYVPGADYTGAANAQYQADLGAANAQNAAAGNNMSGLCGLAKAGIGAYGAGLIGSGAAAAGSPAAAMALFSDRRTKTNIVKVGKADNGLNIYSYQYKWGGPTMLGYMADEVERISPHAVGEVGGFKTVDYARV